MAGARVLLLLPPLSNSNTPYPSTTYLCGYLAKVGIEAAQYDVGIDILDTLLSKAGVATLASEIATLNAQGELIPEKAPHAAYVLQHAATIGAIIEPVLAFLRHQDAPTARRILNGSLIPPGSPSYAQFAADQGRVAHLAEAGAIDAAAVHAGFLIEDVLRSVRLLDDHFEITRYGESILGNRSASFDGLIARLGETTLIDGMIENAVELQVQAFRPALVGVSIAFPGNVYGAFRIAQYLRKTHPKIQIAFGGGFCNTDLRQVEDKRVFDYVDYICLDDGERPLQCLAEYVAGTRPREKLVRTLVRENGAIRMIDTKDEHDVPQKDAGLPTVKGLPLGKYFPTPAPATRLTKMEPLVGAFWNKLTLAHGCYWRRCTFCDVTLDYIKRYDFGGTDVLIDRIDSLVKETGSRNFHFVDEACPPTVLAGLARRLNESDRRISWMGNIRFDKAFTPELTSALARSGCVAVTGGLEVASDRLLKLMDKGITVAQAARASKAFSDAGVIVHAYLMYGFPTQTEQEVVDSLEVVRQLFRAGCLHSAVWHRFTVTIHSPVGKDPAKFRVKVPTVEEVRAQSPHGLFALDALPHTDDVPVPYHKYGPGLHKAVSWYNAGRYLEANVTAWFEPGAPQTTVPPDLVVNALRRIKEAA